MPKTKLQGIVFTALMSYAMAYGMALYNIALNTDGLTDATFATAALEACVMAPIVFVVEFFAVSHATHPMAARLANPQTDPAIACILAEAGVTVLFMCPIMSFASMLVHGIPAGTQVFSTWANHVAHNFPMAAMWQLFAAGPVVRAVFRGGMALVRPAQSSNMALE